MRSSQLIPVWRSPKPLKCARCGVEVDLPFRCNYCENLYCPAHRLPENHDCSETWRVKAVRSARAASGPLQYAEAKSVLLPPRTRGIHFSRTEINHLAVGTALVTAAGLSFILNRPFTLIGIAVAVAIFAMGFILHELAHKYVAQGYGLWAEFRVNLTGVILTALSIFSPLKLIAPGAVVISGFADKDHIGRTAVAGPIVNLVITIGLLVFLPVLKVTPVYLPALFGATINAFLALFNLIPFTVLDGLKVYHWNKRYWATLFALSLVLTAYTNYLLLPF